MNKKSNFTLGRGLGAILGQQNETSSQINSISEIEIEKIVPNENQPRQFFEETALEELGQSIKIHGIIQPITVRKKDSNSYEIISGERRWQAAKKIDLKKIPVYIRDIGDDTILQVALIENIQREDLNSMEIATSYSRLAEEFNMTHQQISEQVGKDRATVSNYIRLLKLPTEIQLGLRAKKISMGHARAILSLESDEKQIKYYTLCIAKDISVRALEAIIAQEDSQNEKKEKSRNLYDKKVIKSYTNHISNKLKSSVKISTLSNGEGEIKIRFKDSVELDRLFEFLNK